MKSILLIGLGNFGMMIAKQIYELGHQVMAVDKNEDRVNRSASLCYQCTDRGQHQ